MEAVFYELTGSWNNDCQLPRDEREFSTVEVGREFRAFRGIDRDIRLYGVSREVAFC